MLLITGAAGHIGNVLVRELLEHGYRDLRAMLLPGEDPSPLAGLPVELIEADVTRPESLIPAMQGVTQVVHLASLVSIGDSQAQLLQRVNVEGARNVLEAARAAGVQRLLYVGSVHAFVPPESGGLDEQRPLMPDTAEPYERTKAAATRLMLDASRDFDVVIAAPSGVFGPWDFKRSEMGSLFAQWVQKPFFVGIPGGYDFTDVRDVARGLRLALEKGRRGEIYLLGGEFIEISLTARQAMHKSHGRANVWTIPLPLAQLIALGALEAGKRLKKRPVLTPYSVKTLQAKYFVDSSKARRELGYHTRPVSETIHDVVEWWREHPELGLNTRRGSPLESRQGSR